MTYAIAAFSGLVFAYGLVRSGMVEPQRVIGFLDVTGAWDPSLALVMAGAVLFGAIVYPLVKKLHSPIWSLSWHLPTKQQWDWNLVFGSAVFGIGWGIVGICPGPALVNIAQFDTKNFAFLASMLAGMFCFRLAFPLLNKIGNRSSGKPEA